jgi:TetR/AcrR family transcriptional regulator, transcriptional repressor for nem operon
LDAIAGNGNGDCHCHSALPYASLTANLFLESGVMGVSKKQATRNKHAIIAAATRLFRERGVDGVGLNELMREAGFTQGGFYNHFKSKDALVAEVVATAMTGANDRLSQAIAKPLEAHNANPLVRQIKYYLSTSHRDDIEKSCAIACLAPDARRMSEGAQAGYAQGLDTMLEQLAAIVEGEPSLQAAQGSPRERAIALYSQMMGAFVLSRAVVSANRTLANEILSAARGDLLRAVGDDAERVQGGRRQSRVKAQQHSSAPVALKGRLA